jgi:hypothetical protein
LENRPKSPSLWLAMFRAYGGPYAVAAFFKIGNDIAQYIQPQLLRLLLTWVKSYNPDYGVVAEPVIKGAAIALAMFSCAVFQTTMVVCTSFLLRSPLAVTRFATQDTDLLISYTAPILPTVFRHWYEDQGRSCFYNLP